MKKLIMTIIIWAMKIAAICLENICYFIEWLLATRVVVEPKPKETFPTFVVHSMPIDCSNQKRKCQTCKLNAAKRDIIGCPLSKN